MYLSIYYDGADGLLNRYEGLVVGLVQPARPTGASGRRGHVSTKHCCRRNLLFVFWCKISVFIIFNCKIIYQKFIFVFVQNFHSNRHA